MQQIVFVTLGISASMIIDRRITALESGELTYYPIIDDCVCTLKDSLGCLNFVKSSRIVNLSLYII